MNKFQKIITAVLAILLCFVFVVAVIDTKETSHFTRFSQIEIKKHIEKLTENGPRSIANKEANDAALNYITATLDSYGVEADNTTEKPAYIVQDYVATDTEYQNWYLKNIIVHIPATTNRTGDAIMFMAHTDSVPMGDGASDDGVACSVMLEAVRYYLSEIKNGYTLENDLVFCFVNGEEYGLYGSNAFMNEFKGFDNVVDRIKFGTNLESRGTEGTLIMFETAKNNYNTVKLFSELNKNIFTCSIATMVYDMMPNYTDFTNFKEAYQGINMANILGGENYHTQNDSYENAGDSYISQQAQIVDALIDKLSSYELEQLYQADESAIFFSYLNITTVVYNHTAVIVFAVIAILLLIANIVLSRLYRKERNLKKTSIAIGSIVLGLAVTAGFTYLCYFIFQYVAVLFGVIDIHMVGTITYSNTAIIIGMGIVALALTSLVSYLACKWFKISYRDLTRGFAYIHSFLGIVLSFALPDASYLFIFSGIAFMINELLVTVIKKTDFASYHGDLLVTALYFPIIIPIVFLATSALGLKMTYVYGLVFALGIFNIGTAIAPICKYLSIGRAISKMRGKEISSTPVAGSLHILAIGLIIFLCVSVIKPNASVNLQGKQNIAKLPYDDALVYVLDEKGDFEYRVYDLNAYGALKKYCPDMEYYEPYYVGEGDEKEINLSIKSTHQGNIITVNKTAKNSLVYLDFSNINAESFTIDDGATQNTYIFEDDTYTIKIHTNCTVTLNRGSADVEYKEVIRDYTPLIPKEYANDSEKLHFNLWLTKSIALSN